jgi:DNA repair photolyase
MEPMLDTENVDALISDFEPLVTEKQIEEIEMDSNGRESIVIKNDAGLEQKATTSLIISASRKTDITAHYSDWFLERLRQGYLKVKFPAPRYISFEKTRLIVFWTKDPQPMIKHLDEIDDMRINYYFQYTLNDYEEEKLEPNVPPLEDRITTFKTLSKKIGKEKVVWRFDPLILTDNITPAAIVWKTAQLMKQLHPYTNKLVISFLQASTHNKVVRNLTKANIKYRDFHASDIKYISESLGRIAKDRGIEVMTCSDKNDLSEFGIGHNKCIDDNLIRQLFSDDEDLLGFVSSGKRLKDKGQRPLCGCIHSMDIGTYNTCSHLCLYCYANNSENAVKNNIQRITHTGELLVPEVNQ